LHQRMPVASLADFQLVDQHTQGFFVLPVAAEPAVLGGLVGFWVIEGLGCEVQGARLRTLD
jgi:hypothetical protein